MKNKIRYVSYAAVTLLLLLVFQRQCAYDFFYTEQLRTFLFSEAYAREVLARPGGMLEYAASFITQFYVYDFVGPFMATLLFGLMVWLCDRWLLRFGAELWAPLAGVLTAGLFIILELDMDYRMEGTLAAVLCLAVMNLYAKVRSYMLRMAALAVGMPLLYVAMGPAVMVLAACICLWETTNRHYSAWLLLAWSVMGPAMWWYMGNCGEARTVFLPDAYYNVHLVPKMKVYYPWYLLMGISAAACLWRLLGISVAHRKWMPWADALQVVVAAVCVGHLFSLAHGEFHYQLKRLDCHRIRGQWNDILAEDLASSKNTLHACFQNLALAQKGVLADSLFHYPQCPPDGLAVEWDGSRQRSDLLSDIYWLQGNVALSQKMAFDAVYFYRGFVHPRLMLRLVETNLVYGEYAVAEKYIRLCEQSHYYAERATAYRKYLPQAGDEEAQKQLGEWRKSLPTQGGAILSNFYNDTKNVLLSHPGQREAMHYLGCKLLLDNNLEDFKLFIEEVCQAEYLRPMPQHFQEALLMIFDEEKCREYGVTDSTIARYRDFNARIAKVKTQADVASIFRAGFGHTFWVHSTIYEKQTRK